MSNNDVGPVTYDMLEDLLSNISVSGGTGGTGTGDATQAWCAEKFVPISSPNTVNLIRNVNDEQY
jgi:hypothetical protein